MISFIAKYVWVLALVAIGIAYWHWVTSYNASLAKWDPIVAECSNHGGFMNAKGVCDYNQ